ncbi:MAG: hypothetical protein NTU89_02525 [Candidatus Dependentiae bacterium]|nr:hypothetical protein [Candidatus Dependentiae bacterium]
MPSLSALLEEVDSQRYPELAKFMEKYRCSEYIEISAEEEDESIEWKYRDWQPQKKYYSKRDTGSGEPFFRVINSARLRNAIHLHNLECLDVAKKCVSKTMTKSISSAISRSSPEQNQISLLMVQQLAFIAEEIGYGDWAYDLKYGASIHSGLSNAFIDVHGKIIFVDTDDRACKRSRDLTSLQRLEQLQKFMQNSKQYVAPEALDWLENRKSLLKDVPGEEKPLNSLSAYDDKGISFDRVEREFYAFKQDAKRKRNEEFEARRARK